MSCWKNHNSPFHFCHQRSCSLFQDKFDFFVVRISFPHTYIRKTGFPYLFNKWTFECITTLKGPFSSLSNAKRGHLSWKVVPVGRLKAALGSPFTSRWKVGDIQICCWASKTLAKQCRTALFSKLLRPKGIRTGSWVNSFLALQRWWSPSVSSSRAIQKVVFVYGFSNYAIPVALNRWKKFFFEFLFFYVGFLNNHVRIYKGNDCKTHKDKNPAKSVHFIVVNKRHSMSPVVKQQIHARFHLSSEQLLQKQFSSHVVSTYIHKNFLFMT